MTPDEIEDSARYLYDRQQEISQLVQQLDAKVREISERWEGQAQIAFLEQYDEMLFPVLNDTLPQVIYAMYQKLNGAAHTIRETDSQIAQVFRG